MKKTTLYTLFTLFLIVVFSLSVGGQRRPFYLLLHEVQDVSTTSPTDGQALVWNSTTSLWTPGVPATGSLKLDDTDDSNELSLVWNEDDSSDRTLNFKVQSGDRTLELYESLTVGDGNDGTLTFGASGKTLTVNDDAVVNQDVSTTGDPTFDDPTMDDIIVDGITVNYLVVFDEEYDEGSETGAFTIDWNNGQKQKVTITGTNLDMSFTDPSGGPCNVLLKIVQGDGSDTVDWTHDTKIYSSGGVAPTLSTGSGDIDIISLYWDGSYYYITYTKNFEQIT